ncbi:hypothetical protein B0T10DRAFT_400913 [Thelonectria olida]|uniref:Uncharacterized protein n=1 Tax=Thelonectria olida TaxID=1576542 RepID=A0A9P8WAH8_9HYPO|nr:hypothetical protein B0T10DRAFT_400913 [Thelonectria olida]
MSKYAAVHSSPTGPGDARPTALQIIQDNDLEGKLSEEKILITGCSSGIGIETARALAKTGATLYLTARDLEKAKEALDDLVDSDKVHLLALDLNSFASVRACAAEFLSKSSSLNILINNAGVMVPPEGRTVDGWETQFGTNHLAHFLLIQLLTPALLSASKPGFESRVVQVSSSGHRQSEVMFDNVNMEGNYESWKGYGQSKTAMNWTANEIERRYGSRGLHAFSLHPGGILSGLQKYVTEEIRASWGAASTQVFMKSTEQGAATTVWAAVAKELEGTGGKYLEDCQVIGPWDPATGLIGPGYAPWTYDEEKATKLWEKSLEWVGEKGGN